MTCIGILGGGQLGCMLAESLYRLGADVAVYDPDPDAPLCRRTSRRWNAAWDDVEQLRRFGAACTRVTYEFENVESSPLRMLAAETEVWPGVEALFTTQHRGREKRFMQQAGLPHVPFFEVDSAEALPAVLARPSIIKTVRGGYDGKGQARMSPGDPIPALQWPCVVEDSIAIEQEASCIVARSLGGEEVVFPVFENEHRDHILDLTIVPAGISPAVQQKMQELALMAARTLKVVGLLTTEFFLSRQPPGVEVDGWFIVVNEFAPRPHNSGHVTRQACTLSQFDVLARILLNVPLARPQLVDTKTWAMGNLLGDVYGARPTLDLSPWGRHPQVRDVCLYGKTRPRPGRKMGHFVLQADDASLARRLVATFRAELQGQSGQLPPGE